MCAPLEKQNVVVNSPWSPHITVATIVEDEGRFLFVREHDEGIEVINQPAGHWEYGETLQQAALRETLEETGWQVALTGFCGTYCYTSPRNGVTYQRVAFTARPLSHTRGPLDEGIIEAIWMTADELVAGPYRLRSPMVVKLIDDYQRRGNFPLELVTHVED